MSVCPRPAKSVSLLHYSSLRKKVSHICLRPEKERVNTTTKKGEKERQECCVTKTWKGRTHTKSKMWLRVRVATLISPIHGLVGNER